MHDDPMTSAPTTAIELRARREDDLPELETVLAGQQPTSRYPFRWPLPFPAREFIVREGELRSWVAVVEARVVGHVSVTAVQSDLLGTLWVQQTRQVARDLACVAVLFVDPAVRGLGVGGALMNAAEQWIFASGRTAVLDVVQKHSDALAIYRHRGWHEIGRARPEWLPAEEPPVILMAKNHP